MSVIFINPYTFAAAETFLLDTYPGAAAAYSLRNLSSSTTNVVRVRRSSGSPSEADFTALQVANGELAAWVGAGNNGFVAIWYDQSGNGNDASNTINQPKIVTNGAVSELNTKPCITYNTSGTDSLSLDTRLTTVRSVFEVLQIDSNQLNAPNFLLGDTTNYDYHGGGSTWLNPSLAAAVVRNGSNRINNEIKTLTIENRVSSQLLISMIHTGNAAASRISADRTLSGRSIRGLVQEVIIYTTDQTSNVAGINGNIDAHYAIYTDPNFANVSVLLHGDGTNGSQTILDSSSTPKTVTVFGNTQISTAQSKFGGSSIAFDGSGDFITLPGGEAFEFGTGDFTVELWIRFASVSSFQGIIDTRASGSGSTTGRWGLYADGPSLTWFQNNGSGGPAVSSLSANTWYFLTLCRVGGNCRIFADGVQIGSTYADTGDYGVGASRPVIGAFGNNTSGSNFNGFIDEFRITKGVGRYTAAFTPPTAPFPDA